MLTTDVFPFHASLAAPAPPVLPLPPPSLVSHLSWCALISPTLPHSCHPLLPHCPAQPYPTPFHLALYPVVPHAMLFPTETYPTLPYPTSTCPTHSKSAKPSCPVPPVTCPTRCNPQWHNRPYIPNPVVHHSGLLCGTQIYNSLPYSTLPHPSLTCVRIHANLSHIRLGCNRKKKIMSYMANALGTNVSTLSCWQQYNSMSPQLRRWLAVLWSSKFCCRGNLITATHYSGTNFCFSNSQPYKSQQIWALCEFWQHPESIFWIKVIFCSVLTKMAIPTEIGVCGLR